MTLNELKREYGYLFEINDAKNLYDEMAREEKKYSKLKEFAFSDYIATVKRSIKYYEYLYLIPSAKDYFFKSQDKDTDKRTKEYKESKETFKLLESRMNEWFQQPVKIVGFFSGGYEGYYEEIQFTSGSERKFSFTIPVANRINERNFECVYEGKLTFGEYLSDNFTHEIIKTSYMFEDILKAFKKAVEEKN
jgi:hypothetical protein